MIKALMRIIAPKYKPLFGKWIVSDIYRGTNTIDITIGEKKNPLSITRLYRNPPNDFSYSGDFMLKNSNANPESFKEFYSDAKEHFRKKGVRVDDRIVPEVLNKFAFLRSSTYLSGCFKDYYGDEREETRILETCRKVDKFLYEKFKDVKEEIAPYKELFIRMNDVKIWTPKDGLWVVYKASVHNPLQFEVNSDETHKVGELTKLQGELADFLLSNFEISENHIYKQEPKHYFNIDLRELKNSKFEDLLI